jgi:hypothetical protein
VNERQAYAYAHPISDPRGVVADPALKRTRKHPRGMLILTILAVDR